MNLETRERKRKRREPLLSRVPLLFLLSSAPSCVLTCEATKGVVSVEQKHSLPTSAAAVRRKDEKDSFFSSLCGGVGVSWAALGGVGGVGGLQKELHGGSSCVDPPAANP